MNDDLNDYIEAASESSARARNIIIVLLTASVIVFAPLWNMRQSSWAIYRLRCAEAAAQYLTLRDHAARPTYQREPDMRQGEICAELFNLTTRQEASAFLAELRAQMDTLRYLKRPFFDVTFDSRDLGVLSGIAFAAILLRLRFALRHEHHNLRRVFALCPEDRLRHCYRLLAMRQVLTTSPSLTDELRPERLWRFAVRLFFVLPVFLQLYAYGGDLRTLAISHMFGGASAIVTFTMASLFMVISLTFTISSLRLAAATDKQWMQAARAARKASDNAKRSVKRSPCNDDLERA